MSKASRMGTYDWQLISEEFLDYLGALSAETPDLNTPEAKAILQDAAEAATGAVSYAAYYPYSYFTIFLSYVNFGMSYDVEPASETDPDDCRESVTAGEWLDAFCLSILVDKTEHHGEAFHFGREEPQEGAAGRPPVELINGLMAYVIGDTGDDSSYPPSKEEKIAAIDAAISRIHALDNASDHAFLDHPHTTALFALRALSAGEQEAFRSALTNLLLSHSTTPGPGAEPRTLLPLLPLALAALAYRRKGWSLPVQTDYLPRALVTGFEESRPRVGAFGSNRRPDAVAHLTSGSVQFERPEHPKVLTDDNVAWLEGSTKEVLDPNRKEPVSAADWSDAMHDQELLFRWRSTLTSDITDEQWENLTLASRLGAGAFRAARGEASHDSHYTGAWRWLTAVNFALITGTREDLATLVLIDPTLLADGSAYASYYQALHDYLRSGDPEAATERAVHDCAKAQGGSYLPPPTILLSQLVEGDEESFNLALLDALEAHRDHYRLADRAEDSDAAVNLHILALTCHARRRGWNIHISSPYLPARLLQAANPL
ncbi:Imm49 family immunity protein [Actinomycetota bacterium Odt1-20B]